MLQLLQIKCCWLLSWEQSPCVLYIISKIHLQFIIHLHQMPSSLILTRGQGDSHLPAMSTAYTKKTVACSPKIHDPWPFIDSQRILTSNIFLTNQNFWPWYLSKWSCRQLNSFSLFYLNLCTDDICTWTVHFYEYQERRDGIDCTDQLTNSNLG